MQGMIFYLINHGFDNGKLMSVVSFPRFYKNFIVLWTRCDFRETPSLYTIFAKKIETNKFRAYYTNVYEQYY